MNIGTLLLIATKSENTLSNKALFFAIPFSSSILSATYDSSFKGMSKKSLPIKDNFFNDSFISFCNSSLDSISGIRK